jgi:hypothetical protein
MAQAVYGSSKGLYLDLGLSAEVEPDFFKPGQELLCSRTA